MNRNTILTIILFFFTIVALGLSIWSFVTQCKDKSSFGDILSAEDCKNSPLAQRGPLAVENCERNMGILSTDIGAQGWGHSGNRGVTYPGGAYGGAFGDPNVIGENNWWNWKKATNNINSTYRAREEREDIYNQRYRRNTDREDDEVEEYTE